MTRRPKRNQELLRRTGDAIVAHAKQYDQGDYHTESSCGSLMCVAGFATRLSPDFWDWANRDEEEAILFDGTKIHPRRHAEATLGLTVNEADILFSSTWHPVGHKNKKLVTRVRDALYALANGASIYDVTADS